MSYTGYKFTDNTKKKPKPVKCNCVKKKYVYPNYKKEVKSKYPEEYREILWGYRFNGNKTEVLKRDNFKCQRCGISSKDYILKTGKELTAHHIDGNGYDSKSPNHKMSNLVTLCQSCHQKEHHKKLEYCQRGHKFTEGNSYYRKDTGKRMCQECQRYRYFRRCGNNLKKGGE